MEKHWLFFLSESAVIIDTFISYLKDSDLYLFCFLFFGLNVSKVMLKP